MANRHFAKLADVWKHLPLLEVLSTERPSAYWESHAGSAVYPMVDDPERAYGARRLVQLAPDSPALSGSRYVHHLRAMNPSGVLEQYPGSAMLAMSELGAQCEYVLCDLDGGSQDDLTAQAAALGLADHVTVVAFDGMTTLHERLAVDRYDTATLAHIDPFDPWAVGPSGHSAIALAHELIERDVMLVYWYGYDGPTKRAWAFDELRAGGAPRGVWCGDVMVVSSETAPCDGDLGAATTSGTGFGVVCANVSATSIAACERMGRELARVYDGSRLPDGSRGRLEFTYAHST